MKKSILALSLGSFSIGMTEFTMMGILPDIAQKLHVDIPTAGHLISLYALGVVIGAPLLVTLTSKMAPKKVLLGLMAMFVFFNGVFAVAQGYHLILLCRFLAGLPHGAFFGVGTVVASRLADKGKEAQAIAFMFTGMTIANLAGVPLGTYIGHHYSWRVTYGFVAFSGLVTIAALFAWLPTIANHYSGNIFKQFAFFKTKVAWLTIAIIGIGTGGLFAWISYIAPLAVHVAHIAADKVAVVMVLVGLGMVVGNLLGGKLADAITPPKAVIVSFSSMMLCLLIVFFTSQIQWLAYLMAFVTGAASFSNSAPVQMMLINAAKGSETIAAAAGQASFNFANSIGAYLGGLPIVYGCTYNTPSLVGAAMAGIGVWLAIGFMTMQKKSMG
ncbi:MAG: MFS transporter [Chitinophagaceae bacterium]